MLETLRARRVIESAIANEALVLATADDLAEIERTVVLLCQGISSAQLLRADMMFHRAVARAAHNRVLEEAQQVVYRHLAPVRDIGSESDEVDDVRNIHQAAGRDGDARPNAARERSRPPLPLPRGPAREIARAAVGRAVRRAAGAPPKCPPGCANLTST